MLAVTKMPIYVSLILYLSYISVFVFYSNSLEPNIFTSVINTTTQRVGKENFLLSKLAIEQTDLQIRNVVFINTMQLLDSV